MILFVASSWYESNHLEESFPTVVLSHFGQILDLNGEILDAAWILMLPLAPRFVDLFLTDTFRKKSSNGTEYKSNG